MLIACLFLLHCLLSAVKENTRINALIPELSLKQKRDTH